MTGTADQRASVARALIGVLDAENDALSRMDIDGVAAALAEKRRLLALLEAQCGAHARDGVRGDSEDDLSARLTAALERNRSLLRVAMAAQRSLMTMIAAAARRTEQPPGYAGDGALARPRSTRATAIIATA